MAIFSRKSKAKKEAESKAPAADSKPAPAPYRHVPTHAAADSVGQGSSDKSKDLAQIALASQRRLQNIQFDSALGNAAYTQSIAHSMVHGMPSPTVSFASNPRKLYNPMLRNQSEEVFTTDPDAPPMPHSPALSQAYQGQSQSRSASRSTSRQPSMTRTDSDYFAQLPHPPRAPDSPTLGSLKVASIPGQGPNPHYSSDSGYESASQSAMHSRATSEQNSYDNSRHYLPLSNGFLPEMSLSEELMSEPAFSEHSFSEDKPLELATARKPQEGVLKGFSSKPNLVSEVKPKRSSMISKKTRFEDPAEPAPRASQMRNSKSAVSLPGVHEQREHEQQQQRQHEQEQQRRHEPQQQRQEERQQQQQPEFDPFRPHRAVSRPIAEVSEPKSRYMEPARASEPPPTQPSEPHRQYDPLPEEGQSPEFETPRASQYLIDPVQMPEYQSQPSHLPSRPSSPPLATYQHGEYETPRASQSMTYLSQPYVPAIDQVISPTGSRRESVPPLSILDGLKVNKRGFILDEEGDAVGELIEGSIVDCVRQKANAYGEVLDECGSVVGIVRPVHRPSESISSSSSAAFGHRSQYSEDAMSPLSPATRRASFGLQPVQQQQSAQQLYSHLEHPQPDWSRGRSLEPVPQWSAQGAVAPTRPGNEFLLELDGSAQAEAMPVLDHSDIFCPPFVPPTSPGAERKPSAGMAPEKHKSGGSMRQQLQPAQQEPVRRLGRSVSDRSASDLTKSYAKPSMSSVPENNVVQDDGTDTPAVYTYKGEIPPDNSAQQAALLRAKSPAASATLRKTGAAPSPSYMPKSSRRSSAQYANGLQPTPMASASRGSLHAPLKRSPLSSHEATPHGSDEGDYSPNPEEVRPPMPSYPSRSRPASIRSTVSTNTLSNKPRTYFTHSGKMHVAAGEMPPPPSGPLPNLPAPVSKPVAGVAVAADDNQSTMSKKSRFSGFRFGRKNKAVSAR